jgi:heptosyltransferase-1
MMAGEVRSILVLRLDSYGDLILSSQILPALRSSYPNAQIHWVAMEPYAELLVGHPDIDQLWRIPASSHRRLARPVGFLRWISRMRENSFDLLIDLHDTGWRPAALTALLRADLKVGFNNNGRSSVKNFALCRGTNLDHSVHMLENYRAVLSLAGINWTRPTLGLPIRVEDEAAAHHYWHSLGTDFTQSVIMCCPFSTGRGKTWSLAGWVDLIARILSERVDTAILLLGDLSQRDQLEQLRLSIPNGSKRVVNSAGELTLAQAASLAKRTTMILTVDTSWSHVATVMGHPALVLIRESAYQRWKPLGARTKSVIAHRIRSGRRMKESVPSIPLRAVQQAFDELQHAVDPIAGL